MSLSQHSRLHVLAGASMLLVLAGCVTINIYFPAAAAEKAADRIIDEVWQLREGQQPPGTPAALPATPGAGGARP